MPHTDPAALRRDIESASVPALPELGRAALTGGEPALALMAFERLAKALGANTPPAVFGLQAQALHLLGRYGDASDRVNSGLGDQARLIVTPPAASEAQLLARWRGDATPVVSILCTTFNHERYIEQALHGFLSQDTEYAFEVLVHDDASTDRTAEILREWQARYPTVLRTTLQTENQFRRGVRPMELLLAQARGRYIATCEGDDYWVAPSKLQRQVAFLEAHPDFSCTAHNYYHLQEAIARVEPWIKTREQRVFTPRQLMAIQRLLWAPTLVFRRTFDRIPPERALAAVGDQFFTAFIGTFGAGMYFEDLIGSVRRENSFSTWSPLDATAKERMRVRTWMAVVCLHANAGRTEGVNDVFAKIAKSPLDPAEKQRIIDEALMANATLAARAA